MRWAFQIHTPTIALAVVLFVVVLSAAPFPARALLKSSESPIDILGQFSSPSSDVTPNYTKGCINNGASSIGFSQPSAVALDGTNHYLFVADYLNSRVLVFTLNSNNTVNSKTPSYVLGQPNFITCVGEGRTQSSLPAPLGLAVDSANQRLFVVDGNNRVMVFSTASMSNYMNASYVLGQANFTSSSTATTQSVGNGLRDVQYDPVNGLLYVADAVNNRVVVFNVAPGTIVNGENASYVLGQTNFTTSTAATTQAGLDTAEFDGIVEDYVKLAYDSTNDFLYVTDPRNNRVMVFPTASTGGPLNGNGENASYVLGAASFTTVGSSTCSQSSIVGVNGLAYDGTNNRLFVADAGCNRVLTYSVASIANGMNASYVLGQSTFTTGSQATSQSGFYNPGGLAYDSGNSYLYVADGLWNPYATISDNRVMLFNVASGTIANGENATDLLGQYTGPSSTATVAWTQDGYNNGPTALGFNFATNTVDGNGIAIDKVNHNLYVTDCGNSRVLVYSLNPDNSFPSASGGHTASYVLGQSAFGMDKGIRTQAGLSCPIGLAFDAVNNRLFVVDAANERVMVFNTASISNGMNASYVLAH
jgi:DNA-binding beta-propeller fold protein YncE